MNPDDNQFGFDPDILSKFLRMTEYIFPETEDEAYDQMRLALHVTQGLKGHKLVSVAVGF
jgi:hypothetical protein